MTSIKLSSISGYNEAFPVKEICQFHPIPKGILCGSCRDIKVLNYAIDQCSAVQVTVDVEDLAKEIYNEFYELGNGTVPVIWEDAPESMKKSSRKTADRISSSLPSILKLEKANE